MRVLLIDDAIVHAYRRMLEEQKEKLAAKLKSLEEKLIKGGEMLSKVSEQENLYKIAQQELRQHAEQQANLARELAGNLGSCAHE